MEVFKSLNGGCPTKPKIKNMATNERTGDAKGRVRPRKNGEKMKTHCFCFNKFLANFSVDGAQTELNSANTALTARAN